MSGFRQVFLRNKKAPKFFKYRNVNISKLLKQIYDKKSQYPNQKSQCLKS